MTATTTDAYVIRQYEPADREGFLSLYGEVFGERPATWFDWKFVENPYADEIPVCVVERDGEVVGARPSVVFPMSVGGRSVLALMQVDPMVHPDHRGQGLFTRMVEHVYDYYAVREPCISVGFPNEAVKSGLEKLHAKLSLDQGVVGRLPEYYRVQNPGALLPAGADREAVRAMARAATLATRSYLRGRDALATREEGTTVERIAGVPADRLAALGRSAVPPEAHATREAAFYEWRFADPRYRYVTYVARREGNPVAAVVAGTRREGGATIAHVSDAVPLAGYSARSSALSAILARVTVDHRDAAVVAAAGSSLPPSVLREHGFHSTESFPLSRASATTYFVARPLVDGPVAEWTVNGRRLADPTEWRISYCEREIG